MSEIGLTEGFFVLQDAGACASPKNNACVVLQSETNNGRTAGHLYVYRDNAWVDVADLVHQYSAALFESEEAKPTPAPLKAKAVVTKKEKEKE